MNTGKTILTVLAGVAAGAVLGILLAPEKGSATRKKILKRREDFSSTFGDKISGKFHKLVTTEGVTRKNEGNPNDQFYEE